MLYIVILQLVGIVVSCYMCCTVKNDDDDDDEDEETEAHVWWRRLHITIPSGVVTSSKVFQGQGQSACLSAFPLWRNDTRSVLWVHWNNPSGLGMLRDNLMLKIMVGKRWLRSSSAHPHRDLNVFTKLWNPFVLNCIVKRHSIEQQNRGTIVCRHGEFGGLRFARIWMI
jgi:hypothetical protein